MRTPTAAADWDAGSLAELKGDSLNLSLCEDESQSNETGTPEHGSITRPPTDAASQRTLLAGQARLLAERAVRGLPIGPGSLQRLVQLGEELDAELLEERE